MRSAELALSHVDADADHSMHSESVGHYLKSGTIRLDWTDILHELQLDSHGVKRLHQIQQKQCTNILGNFGTFCDIMRAAISDHNMYNISLSFTLH